MSRAIDPGLDASGDIKSTEHDTKSTEHDIKSTAHDILTTLGDTFTTSRNSGLRRIVCDFLTAGNRVGDAEIGIRFAAPQRLCAAISSARGSRVV